ncbi:hypothetical protein GCM10010448_62570 [Streptomyces glomeratus]|uniref:Thiamine pyrophosphate enzyme N-terminal TPP-binding domain-containing protein n=1 Tax=Streptomyces glomeratus TaxID=284452 RepID=A0ABP6M318_9ACTN
MSLVADFVLQRLTEWGVERVYGYPGDGINGPVGAFDRAEASPEFIQVRHEEMAAFMACAHAKFTGEVGCCTATSGPGAVGAAWDEALACDGPVVLEFKVDQEIAPIPPHIMTEQGKKAAKAAVRDPERVGITTKGLRQKLSEYAERLPGRHHGD